METGILIKGIIGVMAVLGVVFMSQQPVFTKNVKDYASSQGANNSNSYLQKAQGWISDRFSGLTGGGSGVVLPDVGAIAKTEIEKQKTNLVENATDATKKFLAKEALDVLGVKASDLAKCPTN